MVSGIRSINYRYDSGSYGLVYGHHYQVFYKIPQTGCGAMTLEWLRQIPELICVVVTVIFLVLFGTYKRAIPIEKEETK